MEELYRSLYAKYAAGLSEDEMNSKVQYALQQDPSEFINAFYQKYTGAGPSEDQANYINNYISQQRTQEIDLPTEGEPSFLQKLFGDSFSFGEDTKTTAEFEGESFDLLIDPSKYTKQDLQDYVNLRTVSYTHLTLPTNREV